MALVLESVPEIVTGVAVEVAMLALFAAVIYRYLSGRFLIPKREIVLPNQSGVLVQADRTVRVVGPGACWVRPRQRIILCDMRPRPLQLVGVEVLGSDVGIVRMSLSGSYKVSDPAVYYNGSANSADALHVALRCIVLTLARQQPSTLLVALPNLLTARVQEAVTAEAAALGLEITSLQIWEALSMGFLRRSATEVVAPQNHPGNLVH